MRRKIPALSRFNFILSLLLSIGYLIFLFSFEVCAQGDGFLYKAGQKLFPIGCYELPKDDAGLEKMAESGINLIRCHSKEDLDRVGAVGAMGWVPLLLQQGATDELREKIISVKDHPALAIWEGPDEIVWNFTAYSGLEKSVGIRRIDWWQQAPNAVNYSESQAKTIISNIRDGIQLVRSLDPENRQFWINEARFSDAIYVRKYLDYIDITGCDDYPIRSTSGPETARRVGGTTQRWKQIARGKPVWMVVQAFSWTELEKETENEKHVYPTFKQSRFMAYDVLVHGAKGIMYWGSQYLKSNAFRESIYAVTSELNALQPFLVAPDESRVRVDIIEADYGQQFFGVKVIARRFGRDWIIILVNEDDQRHMGIEIRGLDPLNGHELKLLYGAENVKVENGMFMTRMPSLAVKVFSTRRKWESSQLKGRDFVN